MASIHKRNGSWSMAYKDASGKRHLVTLGIPHSPIGSNPKDTRRLKKENRDKAMVQAIQTEQLAQGSQRLQVIRKRCAAMLASARDTEAEQSGVTLRGYFDDWVAAKLSLVGDSYYGQLLLCKKELYQAVGTRSDEAIVQIDEEDIAAFVDALIDKKLGGRSINKRLHILNEMFGDAGKRALVIIPPVNPDHYQEESPTEHQAFVSEQVESLLAATNLVDWQTAVLLAYYCGMRLGDARSQLWEAVDFQRRVITWVPIKTRRRRQRKAKIIVTPLHPVLYRHLLKVRAMSGAAGFVTPSLANRPVTNLSDEFVGLVRDAGIDPLEIVLPNGRTLCLLTFHSLRHGFATELKRTACPEKEWTKLTGHSAKWGRWGGESISVTAQIYNHVNVEDLRKWVDQLPIIKLPWAAH